MNENEYQRDHYYQHEAVLQGFLLLLTKLLTRVILVWKEMTVDGGKNKDVESYEAVSMEVVM